VKEVTQESATRRPASATIYKVAERAGVSTATVSRLINGSGYVGAGTRKRIETAMRALNYEPNGLARSLTTRQSELLALVLTDIASPSSSQMARGIQDVVQRAGYILIICGVEDARAEMDTARTLRRKRVDGVILTGTAGERSAESAEVLHALCEGGMAMVCIGRWPPHPYADEVSTDTMEGERAAVRHLVSLGHRRIGFIGGQISRGVALGRLEGYRRGLADAGLPAPVTLVREGELDESSGYHGTLGLLGAPDPPTAIVCVNDRTALGAMAALTERGLRVPDDVSLIGFDDIPIAGLLRPHLTTVRQPMMELGRVAAECLIERIAHPTGPHQRRILHCELVVRDSTAPPP